MIKDIYTIMTGTEYARNGQVTGVVWEDLRELPTFASLIVPVDSIE